MADTEVISGTPFTLPFVLGKLRDAGVNGGCLHKNLVNFDVEDITNNQAFMSHIFKLTFRWKDDDIFPKSLILKVPGVSNATDMFLSASDTKGAEKVEGKAKSIGPSASDPTMAQEFLEIAHSKEILFYQLFSTYEASLRIPRFYYGFEFSKKHTNGLIIMEDLTPTAVTVKMLPGLNDAQVVAMVNELAKFHVTSWKNPGWMKKIKNAKQSEVFVEITKQMAHTLKHIKPEWFNNLLDELDPCFTIDAVDNAFYETDKFGFPPCAVHGDLWASNILWKKNDAGEATDEVAAIIDWQMIHSGNPCEDLARLLSLNTTGEYRRANTNRLLEQYVEKVTELMDGNPLFTLPQIQNAFRQSMPFISAYTGFGAPMYYNMKSVVGEGSKTEENRLELLSRVKMFFEDTLSVLIDRSDQL